MTHDLWETALGDELQRFIDSLADQVLILEPGFRIARANQALLRALGRSSDEVVGRRCYEVGHGRSKPCSPPDETCPALEVWNGKTMGRSVHTHVTADGSKRYTEVVASPFRDEEGGVRQVVEVMRDVTAQEQVGAKLVQRNRELAALLGMARAVTRSLELETVLAEALHQAAVVVGADAGAIYLCDEVDGNLVLAAHKGLPKAFAEALAHEAWRTVSADQSRQANGSVTFDRVRPALVERHTPADEVPLGAMTSHPLQVAGRPVGVLTLLARETRTFAPAEIASLTALARGLAVAIENARLFEGVSRAEREWEQTFSAIRDAIAITGPDYRITRVNQAFLEMFGLPEEQVIGRRCCYLFYGARGPTPGFRCHRIMQTPQATPVEVDNLVVPGTYHIALFPLHDERGEFLGLIHSVRDVSEERAMRDLMARNERLVAMGRLAASVAHEINNPLFSIRNCLTLLDDVISGDEPSKTFLHLAKSELDRLAQTVRNLLDFVRPGEEPRALVNLNEALERAMFLTGKQMEYAHVTVIRELAPDLPSLLASGDQLTQVAINLILNAVEAMSDGGQLRIVTRPGPQWDNVEMAPGRALDTVQMIVSDTGYGIPQEHLEAVFEPFFSTKEEVKGVGLGLAISHSIVQRHGGTIEVQSEVNAGSTFTITLPLLTKEEWELWESSQAASSS
ncbi:MAG: PAS domain-containing protein [Anaerolineae bacterium]|jgi:two-component system NtrC family sensor kinase